MQTPDLCGMPTPFGVLRPPWIFFRVTPHHMIPLCTSFLNSIGCVFEEVEGFGALVGFCHCDAVNYKQGVPDPHGNAPSAAPIGRRLDPAFRLSASG